MIKTILVPIRGDGGDQASLGTALAVAKLFGSHIEAAHFRASPQQFAMPAGTSAGRIMSELQLASALETQSEEATRRARQEYQRFCARAGIEQAKVPTGGDAVSAGWSEGIGDEMEQIIRLARQHDLLVMRTETDGRNGFPPEVAGDIIIHRADPVMLAPPRAPATIARKIAIAWKNTPEAARALTAALPLLYRAEKILVISVVQDPEAADPSLDKVVDRLRWHGLKVSAERVKTKTLPPALCLMRRVDALHADLLVMGAYGRGAMHELIFGSFTHQVLSDTPLPVFLSH